MGRRISIGDVIDHSLQHKLDRVKFAFVAEFQATRGSLQSSGNGAAPPSQAAKDEGPGAIFMVALVLWDALFMAKIYVVLHYIFMRYASGEEVRRRWLCLLCFLFFLGAGPAIAFTTLTSNASVFLLGVASICALVFPLFMFPILIFFWKLCKRPPRGAPEIQ